MGLELKTLVAMFASPHYALAPQRIKVPAKIGWVQSNAIELLAFV